MVEHLLARTDGLEVGCGAAVDVSPLRQRRAGALLQEGLEQRVIAIVVAPCRHKEPTPLDPP